MAKKKKKQTDPEKGIPKLRGNLKLKYAASFFQYESSLSKLQAAKAKLGELSLKPEHREVFQAITQSEACLEDIKELQKKLAEVAREICEKHSIPYEDWKYYVVDTETGSMKSQKP